MKIAWQPLPKQTEALIRNEDEILYGGARGGGKTEASLAWLLYHIKNQKYRALVIRRNADDLRDWIDRARIFYMPALSVVKGNPPEIHFPSGAIIRTGHLKDDNAYTKYQGHEYQKIVIEELTHIADEGNYEKLLGSNRSTVDGIKPQVFATTNPDGPGFVWVKKRFCIPDYPESIITTRFQNRTRVFIPSRVEDNPILMQKDPGYVKYLESILDEDLRNAWRKGTWTGTKIKGSIYGTLIEQMQHDKRVCNVPYEIGLPVYTFWDLGVGDATAILFTQFQRNEIRLIDYYENVGQGLAFYKKILDSKPYIYGATYFPHDIDVQELGSGQTRIETARQLNFVNCKVVDRIGLQDGIDAVRKIFSRLYVDEKKCGALVKAMTMYRYDFDDKRGVFRNEPLHDEFSHANDSLRYLAVSINKISGEFNNSNQIERSRILENQKKNCNNFV